MEIKTTAYTDKQIGSLIDAIGERSQERFSHIETIHGGKYTGWYAGVRDGKVICLSSTREQCVEIEQLIAGKWLVLPEELPPYIRTIAEVHLFESCPPRRYCLMRHGDSTIVAHTPDRKDDYPRWTPITLDDPLLRDKFVEVKDTDRVELYTLLFHRYYQDARLMAAISYLPWTYAIWTLLNYILTDISAYTI